MRARLTPEEREVRRKARARFSFSDAAYSHYNPEVEGFGSPDDWERIAGLLSGFKPVSKDENLARLGLFEMPRTLAELKSAFRKRMFSAHPDHGGTSKEAREVMEAFETLRKRYA